MQEEKPSGKSLSIVSEANWKENQAVGKENHANKPVCTSRGQSNATDDLSSDDSIYTLRSPKDKKQYDAAICVTAKKSEAATFVKFQIDTGIL